LKSATTLSALVVASIAIIIKQIGMITTQGLILKKYLDFQIFTAPQEKVFKTQNFLVVASICNQPCLD
jgi:hypothetical protein